MFLMRKKEYLITTNIFFIHSSEDAINEITNLRFLGVSVFWFKSTTENKKTAWNHDEHFEYDTLTSRPC